MARVLPLEGRLSTKVPQRASIVITNYNGRRNLERCLPAVMRTAAHRGLCDEVLVVDDCSSDDSLQFLAENYPSVRVIPLRERSSFLGAANRGFESARNRHVALLSNDMAPAEDLLSRLLPHFEDPDLFVVHAALASPEGKLESKRAIGRFFLGNLKMLNTAQPHRGLARLLLPRQSGSRYSLYSGACGVFDRDKFLELGGLDPLYLPFYWEDVDLCYRAWKQGWRTTSEPSVRVIHHREECGTIRNNFDRAYVRRIERRNRLLFVWRNIDSPVLLLPHLFYLVVSLLVSGLLGRLGFYWSFFSALQRLPQVWQRRAASGPALLSDVEIFEGVLGGESRGASMLSMSSSEAPLPPAEPVRHLGVARPLAPS